MLRTSTLIITQPGLHPIPTTPNPAPKLPRRRAAKSKPWDGPPIFVAQKKPSSPGESSWVTRPPTSLPAEGLEGRRVSSCFTTV